MYTINKIKSEFKPSKFVDLRSGYWYYNFDINEITDSDKTIYSFAQLRIKGAPNLSKCKEAVLKAYLDNTKTSLYDTLLSDGITEQIGDIINMIKVDLGLETEKTPLEKAKEEKLREIEKYDVSTDVNSFILNGVVVWLNKDTRVGLMNSLTIEKTAGKEISTLWFGSIKLEINIEAAIQMLSALELYALECFNKTAEHKQNVENLKDVSKVKTYDYTKGYPEKLTFTV